MVLPGTWHPMTGGAVVQGMGIRTGARDAGAVLELANGDMIGLAESTEVVVAEGTPLAVRARAGRVAYRLRAGSTTRIETPHGALRLPLTANEDSSVGAAGEGVVRWSDGTMTVESYRGRSEIVGPDGRATPLAAGEVGTLGPEADVPLVASKHAAGLAAGTGDAPGGRLLD